MRNRSDPRHDNDQYLAEIEAKMLKSLGITPEEIGFTDLKESPRKEESKEMSKKHRPGKGS